MASFNDVNKNSDTQQQTNNNGSNQDNPSNNEDRDFLGYFVEKTGPYGTFYRGMIGDKVAYLSYSKKLDSEGKQMLLLTKAKKVFKSE